jgi:hypothetical protein
MGVLYLFVQTFVSVIFESFSRSNTDFAVISLDEECYISVYYANVCKWHHIVSIVFNNKMKTDTYPEGQTIL